MANAFIELLLLRAVVNKSDTHLIVQAVASQLSCGGAVRTPQSGTSRLTARNRQPITMQCTVEYSRRGRATPTNRIVIVIEGQDFDLPAEWGSFLQACVGMVRLVEMGGLLVRDLPTAAPPSFSLLLSLWGTPG